MATAPESRRMENRGLLTADDRAFFRGEKDVEDPDKTRREKRHNIRQRIERIGTDIEILREAGQGELVEELYGEIGRYERMEQKIRDLEAKLDDK